MEVSNHISDFFEIESKTDSSQKINKKEMTTDEGDFTTHYIYDSVDMLIRQYCLKYSSDYTLHYNFEETDYIELSFFFGKHIVKDVLNGKPNKYLPFHSYLRYIESGSKATVSFEKECVYEHLDIYLPLTFFDEWSQQDERISEFTKAIQRNETYTMFKNVKISQEVLVLLNAIKTCCYQGIIKEIYVKSKVLEILSILFDQHTKGKEACAKVMYSVKLIEEDKQVLQQVKEYIDTHYKEFPTTEELAKQFFINEHKLKRGFKYLYNYGLFEYGQQKRMAVAIEMLEEGSHSITEIAYDLGYSTAVAFSKAFKKHFGYPPKKFQVN
ncbi:helix-turn-helix domain-containing protein [Myroides pelagicus]|uniref:Helix-turn-helix domain-containing protein n=1 Tax=Myroides pelagicus TaxID=270914 RepID=A0A7K1GMV9_9FLAO|nr:AraC family transcriptional regulator [Myroides pelagicus]MEC4113538.1 AraC family transcriptional regulator [Myroides pelagicus]MTH30070.1 helix-turn-helix domain-containing protein [Myroides pelagicus]